MDAAARLINAEIAQYGEGYFVKKRFTVTKNKDIRALRKGVADGRTAEGITILEDGRLVEWHLYSQQLEYYFPLYGPHEAPIESKMEKNARERKEEARDYITARVGKVKLEAWVTTQQGKDRTLEHWRKMHAIDVVIEKLREWTQDEQDKYRMTLIMDGKKKYDQEQIDAAMERMAA